MKIKTAITNVKRDVQYEDIAIALLPHQSAFLYGND